VYGKLTIEQTFEKFYLGLKKGGCHPQAKFLKIQLTSQFTIQNVYRASWGRIRGQSPIIKLLKSQLASQFTRLNIYSADL